MDTLIAKEPDAADLMTLRAMLRHMQGRYGDEVALYRTVVGQRSR